METRNQNRSKGIGHHAPAFSVLELLVAVSIMTVIVFSLYQMFNQTQKALRSNITQVDVLESGRVALQMISEELEQLEPSDIFGVTNFYAGLTPVTPRVQLDLDETRLLRTNVLQEVFFMTERRNQRVGTGFRVIGAQDGVGSLYRFSVSTNSRLVSPNNLSAAYFNSSVTNPVTGLLSPYFQRVADGIIHFRLTSYDPNGQILGYDVPNFYPGYRMHRQRGRNVPSGFAETNISNVILRREIALQTGTIFLGDAVPAYLDLELGILEPETLAQYNSIREVATDTAEDFLRRHANKVHIFRRRIPIRTAAQ